MMFSSDDDMDAFGEHTPSSSFVSGEGGGSGDSGEDGPKPFTADVSESQRDWSNMFSATSSVVSSGDELTLSTLPESPDCLRAFWVIREPQANDTIRLYVHNRLHDEKSLMVYRTNGEPTGEHIFTGLARGFYDARYFRGSSNRHAEDIPVPVCCVGPRINLDVTKETKERVLIVKVRRDLTEGDRDWLGLFGADEHGNRGFHSVAGKLRSESVPDESGDYLVFNIKLPNKREGRHELRYFLQSSQSLYNGNAYSGVHPVEIERGDMMQAVYNVEERTLQITWEVHSVDPNSMQWIGIYNSFGARLDWDYVCNHPRTSMAGDRGVITLPKVVNGKVVKGLPSKLCEWSDTGVMPHEITGWKLRFYNRYLSEMLSTPVMEVPFLIL